MTIERFCIKFFTKSDTDLDDAIFIDIFHEWIRLRKLDGVLLDVADYRHVPEGPGVMLITHEINFAMDYTEGRFGLFAQRKLGQKMAQPERILELVRSTVAFGALLEADPRVSGNLSLEAGSFHFMSNDRLLLPNTAEAFAEIKPDLEAAAAIIYPGRDVSIARLENDPRDRLTVAVDSGASADMSELLETVGVAA